MPCRKRNVLDDVLELCLFGDLWIGHARSVHGIRRQNSLGCLSLPQLDYRQVLYRCNYVETDLLPG